MPISVKKFQQKILNYYDTHRRQLPWRTTTDPYAILLSEIMLQQTQVDRVIPKYSQFLTTFPTIQTLAQTPLRKVLRCWQGLGYNRRALNLRAMARILVQQHDGKVPQNFDDLKKLPGIGQYTANAVLAFAFNQPVPVIETNIRAVFIHFFFPNDVKITDKQLMPYILKTIYAPHPNRWYQALMDYGTMLKKTTPNPTKKSAGYTKQSPFQGSLREVRGAIIRELSKKSFTSRTLKKKIGFDEKRYALSIKALVKEKMIIKKNNIISIL